MVKYSKIRNNAVKYIGTIAAGTFGIIHAASHLIPAITNIGYSVAEHMHEHENVEEHGILEQIIHNPVANIASLVFVGMGFYYIYKDHKHHKDEKCKDERIKSLENAVESYKEKYERTPSRNITY